MNHQNSLYLVGSAALALALAVDTATAQETDVTQAPNPINAGIQRSYTDQVGAGHGDMMTPDSSVFMIGRDPFRKHGDGAGQRNRLY